MRLSRMIADLVGIAGLAAIVYGIALVSEPAAFIAGGIFAVGVGYLIANQPERAR